MLARAPKSFQLLYSSLVEMQQKKSHKSPSHMYRRIPSAILLLSRQMAISGAFLLPTRLSWLTAQALSFSLPLCLFLFSI
jgi:hypothetical protein